MTKTAATWSSHPLLRDAEFDPAIPEGIVVDVAAQPSQHRLTREFLAPYSYDIKNKLRTA
jgi:hypothetical protein